MGKKIERKETVLKKLKENEESLEFIGSRLPDQFQQFQQDEIVKNAIYKKVEFLLQNMIDIISIISSDLNLGIPTSEEDYIKNLKKEGLITEEWRTKLKDMKGFRNLLVHKYGELDDKIAFENIHNWLDDFNKFIKIIEKILKKYK